MFTKYYAININLLLLTKPLTHKFKVLKKSLLIPLQNIFHFRKLEDLIRYLVL